MKKLFLLILICNIVLIWSNPALSLPFLQLDIIDDAGIYYDQNTDTIVANSDTFTVRALLDPNKVKNDADVNGTFYLSAAVLPQVSQGSDLGSFSISSDVTITDPNVAGDLADGTIEVTGEMTYGRPHYTGVDLLQKHGVFDTYYEEFAFKFVDDNNSPLHTTAPYNSAETAGALQNDPSDPLGEIDLSGGSSDLYYVDFEIDVSGLTDGYRIHFDLYQFNSTLNEIVAFAPFSHDAESGGYIIPEPTTILLVGLGLLGIAGFRKKLRK